MTINTDIFTRGIKPMKIHRFRGCPLPISGVMQRAVGFTLTELLASVLIIAALCMMLMPAVTTFRGAARSLVCKGNLRQIYLGIISYRGENKGMVMRAANATGSVNWGALVASQLDLPNPNTVVSNKKQLGIFRCPENQVQVRAMGFSGGATQCSYGANGFCWDGQVLDGQFLGSRAGQIRNSSELIAVMDSKGYSVSCWWDSGTGCTPTMVIGTNNMNYWHLGKANLIFEDGHAGSTALLRYIGSWNVGLGGYSNGRPWLAKSP